MAKSPTEDTPRFLRELADALDHDKLEDYAIQWFSTPSERWEGASKLRTAVEAMEILEKLSSYVVEHFT